MAGNAVAVYSLEMQGERLADRWLAAASNINPYRWRNGIPTSQEMENAHTAASELSGLPIYVDDSTSVSMDHIRSSARLLKSRNQCDAIIIDYLQLCDMATKQANRNREQEVAQATRKAKLLAKELHIPVVLLSPRVGESSRRTSGTGTPARERSYRTGCGRRDVALPTGHATRRHRPGKRLPDRRTGGGYRCQAA